MISHSNILYPKVHGMENEKCALDTSSFFLVKGIMYRMLYRISERLK
jgi:hypothetical protein